jgi:hypothetical protein
MKVQRRTANLVLLSVIMILSTILIAANPWPARLTIINQTGDNLYIWMFEDPEKEMLKYYMGIEGTTLPRPIPDHFNFSAFRKENTTVFTVDRQVYTVWLMGCGVMMEGKLDMSSNVQLNITPCEDMVRYENPRYLGEPTLEKPNWFRSPGAANWRFKYILPKVNLATYPEYSEAAGDGME